MADEPTTDELFLISAMRMSEEDARQVLMELRWPQTGGRPVCPKCGCEEVYHINARPLFRCKRCRRDISITAGTIFAGSKVSAKELIVAACLFVGGAKGVSSLQLARYLGRNYKTSFVLAHKMRKAIQRPDLGLGGIVQVDGCTIGGHRVADNTADESGKRRYIRKYRNRRIVVVAREPFGKTKAFVGRKESDSHGDIGKALASDSVIHVDGSKGWNGLARDFKVARVEHNEAYSQDGVHTNWAESYFAMLRKMHYGTHHQISARYLDTYANELAWRQDHRAMKESEKVRLLLTHCLSAPPSAKWRGYWQQSARRRKSPSASN